MPYKDVLILIMRMSRLFNLYSSNGISNFIFVYKCSVIQLHKNSVHLTIGILLARKKSLKFEPLCQSAKRCPNFLKNSQLSYFDMSFQKTTLEFDKNSRFLAESSLLILHS
jgi:hypothetical protein